MRAKKKTHRRFVCIQNTALAITFGMCLCVSVSHFVFVFAARLFHCFRFRFVVFVVSYDEILCTMVLILRCFTLLYRWYTHSGNERAEWERKQSIKQIDGRKESKREQDKTAVSAEQNSNQTCDLSFFSFHRLRLTKHALIVHCLLAYRTHRGCALYIYHIFWVFI